MNDQRRRKRRLLSSPVGDDGDLTNVERVFEELRHIQWINNCSSKTLQTILTSFRGNLGRLLQEIELEDLPGTIKYADRKMRKMVTLTLP